jgi:predicted dehydrogenase
MKRKLKLGFIGGSLHSIAGYPHYVASQMDGRWQLVAGAFSSDPLTNRETAGKYQVEKVYDDWQDLIQEEAHSLDAVAVLLPTPLHYTAIKVLLEANIPIICEKALAASLEEISALEKIYDRNKFLVVTNNYSGYPVLRELQHIIQEGKLGKIINIRAQMPQETFLRPPKNIRYPQPWRLEDGYIPTICLDLGVHLHHLSHFLTGMEAETVMADMNSFSKYDVIDDVSLQLQFPNQVTGHFWMSKIALGHRNGLSIQIFGEKGSASWVQENPEKLYLADQTGRKTILDRASDGVSVCNLPQYTRMTAGHPAGFVEAFANLYCDMADALIDFKTTGQYRHPYLYGFEHSRNGLKLFHQARKAYDNKAWEPLL